MNYFIIFMHPSEDSFNGAILREVTSQLEHEKHDVNVLKLSNDWFNPYLSMEEYEASLQGVYPPIIAQEHEKIRQADRLIFIFPLWWGGFPAIGKGYIDRVFSYGFAYELDGEEPIPLLKDKKAALIFTTGTPERDFKTSGLYENTVELINKSIFQFCGITLDGVLHFGDVIQASGENRQKMLQATREFSNKLSR
ncbi:NAD(P)H-dependent oxidoreductase [Bacillus sp. A301a_S52]|nr:NAD(P)H-dependent oxidoreductase [Bacillus sp. A301a_S52]